MKRVRCAIYTRKSSDEGLEQDFNSLDAQREACAAYVLSQASEGWSLLPEIYDDGGISGGTLERPALKRLLADVAAGKLDIIVVYKVDRLTRSLLDFSKLVEAFDKAEVSFVSITQSFNTTTSMGRLTLNMLLSFAQFEREVTAERIRDKIAASKAKGMWMGGTPPLGYRPDGRTLAIVEEHAAIIRDIYRRYLKLGSVRLLADQLVAEGIGAPIRERQSGQRFGGVAFTRGQLYVILKNAIYAGDIIHKDNVYPGQHAAIIARDLWQQVQQKLAEQVRGHRQHRAASDALLAGKAIGPRGEVLITSHATKGKVRYRYYVSRDAHFDPAIKGVRIPAQEIETLVVRSVAALFDDPLDLMDRLSLDITPDRIADLRQRCAELAITLKGTSKRDVTLLIKQVRVGEQQVAIDVNVGALAEMLQVQAGSKDPSSATIIEQVRLTRTGRVLRLLDQAGSPLSALPPDDALIRMLGQARRWWATLCEGKVNIDVLAAQEGVTASWMTRVLRLAFLSPALVDAALDGKLRAGLGSGALIRSGAIPARWEEQERSYLDTGKVQARA